MPSIEHPEMHIQLLIGFGARPNCIAGVIFAGDDPLTCKAYLRKLVKNEQFGGGGTVDLAVVPERRQPLPMVAVKMS